MLTLTDAEDIERRAELAVMTEAPSSEPEHLAFERAILAAPNDDAPRLVYADWLDERGDPEFAEALRLKGAAYWVHLYQQTERTKTLREFVGQWRRWRMPSALPLPVTHSDFSFSPRTPPTQVNCRCSYVPADRPSFLRRLMERLRRLFRPRNPHRVWRRLRYP